MNDTACRSVAPTVPPLTWMASADDGFEHAISRLALDTGRVAGVFTAQCGQLVTPDTTRGPRCEPCDHFSREISSMTTASGDDESLVEEWLVELARRRWTTIVCGDRQEPEVLAALNRRAHWADVIILRGKDHAAAYRTLLRPGDDPLRTDRVVWHYLASAGWTIRAGLTVPASVLQQTPYPIPNECRLPEAQWRPLTIRLGAIRAAW